jgi:hypothetical protein
MAGAPKQPTREEIDRLRHAIAACERGIQDRSGAPVASFAPAAPYTASPADRLPTGFPALDEALGGGLHAGALNEIFTAASGSGALEALMPAIAKAGSGRRLLAWIHPTSAPYPPALVQAGSDLDRWLIVRPLTDDDHLWSIEQTLRSRGCAAMIACLGDLHDLGLRRLQLCAREGGAVAVLLRPAALMSRPSPAAVRIFAEPERAREPRRRRVRMTLLRCRGATSLDSSVILELSRDPLDERSSSWFAHRAPGAGAAGREPASARTRSA